MGSRKRKARWQPLRWPLKKWALLFTVLASVTTFLQNSANLAGSLYDKLVPKNSPVTYAQVEELRFKQSWPTEDLPPSKDIVKVTVGKRKL